jgi:hypothetical protein
MNTKVEVVPLEEAKEQVKRVCVRLALLHLSYAKTLMEELGEEKGKQLTMKSIRRYGITVGKQVKAKAIAKGLDSDPMNYEEDLPSYGMYNDVDILEVDGEKRIRIYGCVMANVWGEVKESQLGRLYCYVDPFKYMAFNPCYKFVHTKTLTDGDGYCEFALRPTTEKDREDFISQDTDWARIDTKDMS